MTMTLKKHELNDPIPTDENSEISSVNLIKPRLIHIESLALAIGSDVLVALIKGTEGDKKAIDKTVIEELIKTLISQERFDLFNQAIAKYLKIKPEEAEMLSLDDLFDIRVIVIGFFQSVSKKVAKTFSDTLSDQMSS